MSSSSESTKCTMTVKSSPNFGASLATANLYVISSGLPSGAFARLRVIDGVATDGCESPPRRQPPSSSTGNVQRTRGRRIKRDDTRMDAWNSAKERRNRDLRPAGASVLRPRHPGLHSDACPDTTDGHGRPGPQYPAEGALTVWGPGRNAAAEGAPGHDSAVVGRQQ